MAVKIDFSKFKNEFASEAEFQKHEEEAKAAREKYFKPGMYEFKITGVELAKNRDGIAMVCKDPTWIYLRYTLAAAGDKEIKHLLMVPTATIYYGEKKDTFLYRKFKAFCTALGIEVDTSQLSSVLREYFADPDLQVGLNVRGVVGYDSAHSVLVRKKDDPEGLLLKLVDRDEKDIVGADGKVVTANSADALIAYCRTHQPEIRYNGFVSILEFQPSATPNKLRSLASESVPF